MPGEWGTSKVENILAVCQSAASAFLPYIGPNMVETIVVGYAGYGPITLLDRGPNNEYIILLNTQDRLWAQLAFQFSHEYCHVFTGHYRTPLVHPFGWFEESLCEVASLYALKRMAETWRVTPPYPIWQDYNASLSSYADDRISLGNHNIGAFQQWLENHLSEMTLDPHNRDLNLVVATQLLPLFLEHPDAWRATTFVNASANLDGDLYDYMAAWRNSVPLDDSPYVEAIASALGLRAPN